MIFSTGDSAEQSRKNGPRGRGPSRKKTISIGFAQGGTDFGELSRAADSPSAEVFSAQSTGEKSKFIPADQLLSWRKNIAKSGGTLAIVTGSFALLQPGNLRAISEAARQASHVGLIVHPDGLADQSSAALESAAVRLEMAGRLRAVSAVTTCSLAKAEAALEQLLPFALIDCLKQNPPNELSAAARKLAARVVDLAPVAGCWTADIQKAIRNNQTPIVVPESALAPLPTSDDLAHFLKSVAGKPACSATQPVVATRQRCGRVRSIAGKPLVTVNGCFDILHLGHARMLALASALGDRLLVLVNDDDSVRRYKGAGRPVFPIRFRLLAVSSLAGVSFAHPFAGDNPLEVLARIRPDIHVKGGSFEEARLEEERRLVESWGGRLEIIPLVPGFSTSGVVKMMFKAGSRPQPKR